MADSLAYRPKAEEGEHNDAEDGDDEIDETGYKAVKDAVLFAIEVSHSMLRKPAAASKKSDTNSPLLAALKCAYHLMQQRIISSPRDLMGVLLYGTEESKFYDEDEGSRGGWSFPHCYLLTDLDIPEADDVKALKQLVEVDEAETTEIFKPSTEPIGMHTVLFCANQIFQQKAANFTSRRLFLVTDNDDPHTESKALRAQATVRAKDLYDLGVTIELFPISSPQHKFETKLFYDDIVYKSTPSDPDAILYNPIAISDAENTKLQSGSTDGLGLLQSLLSTIASKIAPKRALFSAVPLEIAPNLRISVKGYLLYKHQEPARSCYIYLGGEKPQLATGSRSLVVPEEQRNVAPVDIRKAYTFGGEKIAFSEEETKKLRDFGDPVIRLIGFKPQSRLPLWANIKNSTYLYPSEEDYVGSTRVYSALCQKLLKSQLFGLCWFIPRRNATPVMAALVPSLLANEDDKANPASTSVTGAPQGLHIIPLPFADDIRQNPPSTRETTLRAPDELVDAMRPMIRKWAPLYRSNAYSPATEQLNLPKGIYDPSRYPNPSLQWHYRILQALALDEDIPSKPEDKTIPKHRQIDKRVGNEAVEWGQVLEKTYKKHLSENPDAANVGSKRVTPGPSSGRAGGDTKKVKTEPGQAMSEGQMRVLFQKQKLGSLTVAQLKDFCTVKSIPVGGKKADIVERIESWFEQK
jgi:ATP-dependent DNA helicase 2 subunit 1